MFISYAQNCEDVVLWRVLRGIPNGTYVDVGAADPTEFSVTKAFYDRGWSGVNVEPAPEFVEKLRAERPRDSTVAVCAGEAEGSITFHYVPGTGLSTVSDEFLTTIADQQFDIVNLESEVQRLDRILEGAGLLGKDIHFLKVDVEGAEETVLRSIDFSVWRPWVVVVEATEPLSTVQTHASWDSVLVDHGYEFCLFDGLNRFYAAKERSELIAPLSYPAGVFDQPYTVGAGNNELAARAEALVVERDAMGAAYDRLHVEYLAAVEGNQRLQAHYDETLASYDSLKAQYNSALASYQSLSEEHDSALASYQRLQELYDSSVESWNLLDADHQHVLAVLEETKARLPVPE